MAAEETIARGGCLTPITQEDAEYLKACARLSVDPAPGVKVATPSEAANGTGTASRLRDAVKDRTSEKAERERANLTEYQYKEAARQREKRLRKENVERWLEFHDRMSRTHYNLHLAHEERAAALL